MKNHPVGRSTTGQVYSQLAVLSFSIQPGELIQIISTGQGHWVAIFTIGTSHPIVNVYASLYSCAGAHLKVQRCCCNGNWEARAYPQIHGCIHKFATVLALEEKLELLFFWPLEHESTPQALMLWGRNVSSPPKADSKEVCCQDHRRSPCLLQA